MVTKEKFQNLVIKWHVLGMLRLHCFRYQILETLHAVNIYYPKQPRNIAPT